MDSDDVASDASGSGSDSSGSGGNEMPFLGRPSAAPRGDAFLGRPSAAPRGDAPAAPARRDSQAAQQQQEPEEAGGTAGGALAQRRESGGAAGTPSVNGSAPPQEGEPGHMELTEAVDAITGVDASYLTVRAPFPPLQCCVMVASSSQHGPLRCAVLLVCYTQARRQSTGRAGGSLLKITGNWKGAEVQRAQTCMLKFYWMGHGLIQAVQTFVCARRSRTGRRPRAAWAWRRSRRRSARSVRSARSGQGGDPTMATPRRRAPRRPPARRARPPATY